METAKGSSINEHELAVVREGFGAASGLIRRVFASWRRTPAANAPQRIGRPRRSVDRNFQENSPTYE
jgi:hypothetical protein